MEVDKACINFKSFIYQKEGIHPGGFLEAVICNDLSNAVGRADDEDMKNLPAYVAYFYNGAPEGCWGSKKNMKNWKGIADD